jgi:signal transduction histidine kinase
VRARVRSPRPLTRRVRLSLFAVGAVCIVVTAGVFYALWSRQTLALRSTELERQVGVIAAGVAVSDTLPGSSVDTEQARARLLKVEAGIITARLAVADASGTVLFSTAGSSSVAAYPLAALRSSGSEVDARTGVLDVPGVGRVVVVAVPVSFSLTGSPDRYLVGARTLSDIGAADAWVAVAIAIAAAIGLGVALLFGAFLTRGITGPLTRLTEGARAIAAGQWGRQVPAEGDDEVAELAGAFNDMSARVEGAYRAQQEFVGDVSHEIRTPVTSIRGFADAIADGTVVDRDGVKRAAGIIAAEASRLSELTTTLLALSDLEAGIVSVAREPVDTAVLATALRDRFAMVADDRAVVLDVDLEAHGPLADPARVLQVVSTLVDNALRHARGRVRVRAYVDSGRWVAEVDDDGPGIPEPERERVFGRFTRLDSARSGGGSGLGLAICRHLVELMGGRVRADASPDLGGARFLVDLPAAGRVARSASTTTQPVANAAATPTEHRGPLSGDEPAPRIDAGES